MFMLYACVSSGNVQKSAQILQRAYEMDAKPTEMLQAAMQNLKAGRNPLSLHGDKENIAGKLTLTPWFRP